MTWFGDDQSQLFILFHNNRIIIIIKRLFLKEQHLNRSSFIQVTVNLACPEGSLLWGYHSSKQT